MLTFLRSDRRLRGEDGVPTLYYALLLPEFRKHLGEIGVSLPVGFQSALSSLYKGYLREGVLQLFLARGSKSSIVPAGVEGRKSPDTVYSRAIMLPKHVLAEHTVHCLDKGRFQTYAF